MSRDDDICDGQYLIASDSLLMLVVLPEHVSKTPPGRGISVVNAQCLTVALLSRLAAHLTLCPP